MLFAFSLACSTTAVTVSNSKVTLSAKAPAPGTSGLRPYLLPVWLDIAPSLFFLFLSSVLHPFFQVGTENIVGTHLRVLSCSQRGQWDCAPDLHNMSSAKFKTLRFFLSFLRAWPCCCHHTGFARKTTLPARGSSLGADWGTIAETG